MQILLPLESFRASAELFDNYDLQQQCLFCKQMLMCLENLTNEFSESESFRRWSGFNGALALYGFVLTTEARRRNLSTVERSFFGKRIPKGDFPLPNWLGKEDEE